MRTVEEEVDMCVDGPWTCSCSFYKGCLLPCRHLLYIADSYKGLTAFSVQALAPRWKLSEAALLLGKIRVAIAEASLLRVRRARRGLETAVNGVAERSHDPAGDGDAPDFDDTWVASANQPVKPNSRRTKPVILLTLRRGEIGQDVVLGDIEKRNVVRSQLDRLTTYMMAQGVSRFRSCVVELDAVLAALLESWQMVSTQTDTVDGSEAETPQDVCDVAEGLSRDEMTGGLPQDVQDEMPHTDEPVTKQNQYVFDEDCSGCGDTNLVNAMSPMRLTRVHSPWTSPSPADMFSGFDYYDVPILLDSAIERGAENGFSPPHPSVVADFQKQRPPDASVAEMIETIDTVSPSSAARPKEKHANDYCGTESKDLLTPAVAVMESVDLSSRSRQFLHDIDQEPTNEHAAQVAAAGASSYDTHAITANAKAELVDDYCGAVQKGSSEPAVALIEPAGLSSRSRQLLRDIDQEIADEHAVQVAAMCASSQDTRTAAKRKIEDISGEAPDVAKEHHARANTVIDSIVTQAVLSRGHRRRTPQKGPSTGRRRVAIDVESDCPVYLEDLLLAVDFTHLSVAKDALAKYTVKLTEKIFEQRGARATRSFVVSSEMRLNYVVPRAIFNILDAAVKGAKEKDHVEESTAEIEHQRVDRQQYVTTIVGTAGQLQFSEDNIGDIRGYFERQRVLAEYTTDLQWLTAKVNWGAPNARDLRPVPFLQAEVNDLEGLVNTMGTQKLRDEVRSVLDRSSIETVLSVPGKSCRIAMKSLIGRLARRTMLNDSVVNFALNLFASAYDDVVIIDSLNYGQMTYPRQALRDIRVVIFPLNFGQAHWGVICVSLPGQPGATAFLYEALGQAYWQDQLTAAWNTWCLPLLEAWASRDEIREGATVDLTRYLRPNKLKDFHLQYTATPKQLDSSSCGLFCVLQGYVYMSDQYELHNFENLNAFQVKIIRARLLWYILSRAEMSTDPIHAATAAQTLRWFAAS